MGACCGSKSATVQQTKGDAELDTFVEVSGPRVPDSIPFDVLVPANGGGLLSSQRSNANNSFSVAMDQSMHTVRDLSLDRTFVGHGLSIDNSYGFTNSFTAVNRKVVQTFMQNIERLASDSTNGHGSILEESLMIPGGAEAALDRKSLTVNSGISSGGVLPEDTEYIMSGTSLRDRLFRLDEVEAALRQNLEGAWRVDAMLLQLACCQLLPTLRQRRRSWVPGAAHGSGSRGGASGHRPTHPAAAVDGTERRSVLVIHAHDLLLDANSSGEQSPSLATSQSLIGPARMNNAEPDIFSPTSPTAADQHAESSPDKDVSLERMGSHGRFGADAMAGKKVEHYEMLALTCRDIPVAGEVPSQVEHQTWDFLSVDAGPAALCSGKCIFRFMCQSLADVDDETRAIVNAFVNVSSFKDETVENNTPRVNVYDTEDASKYIGIIVKAMYMLPGVSVANITPELITSHDYQKACQPSENKVLDCDTPSTFRLSLGIIKYVFSLTVQFKVSEITDPVILDSFSLADGMVPAKVLMLERTKRSVAKVDATAKARSMLLYYPVNDGVLVNSHTIVLNTSMPKMVSKLMNTFGSQGASQSAQTVRLTREFLGKKLGDGRKKR